MQAWDWELSVETLLQTNAARIPYSMFNVRKIARALTYARRCPARDAVDATRCENELRDSKHAHRGRVTFMQSSDSARKLHDPLKWKRRSFFRIRFMRQQRGADRASSFAGLYDIGGGRYKLLPLDVDDCGSRTYAPRRRLRKKRWVVSSRWRYRYRDPRTGARGEYRASEVQLELNPDLGLF